MWEYDVLYISNLDLQEQLSNKGEAHWKLIHFGEQDQEGDHLCIFIREKV